MNLWITYIKSKRKLILLLLAFALIFVISFQMYHLPVAAVLYPAMLCGIIGFISLFLEYRKIKALHEQLEIMKESAEEMIESLPDGVGLTGPIEQDYKDIIDHLCEENQSSKTDALVRYKDMVDYYTIWAHQIKTPIAAMDLNLQNALQQEDSDLARSLKQDLKRIERYVEMVLAFLRLNSDSSDYVFKEQDLDQMIRAVVKDFASEFIGKRIALSYQSISYKMITDEKWFSFVLEQLLSNAIKYTDRKGKISIYMAEGENVLCIEDNGIGIAAEDLPRIFEKGYTGFNGRMDKKASGIGLYLCKQVCDRLGHGISVTSEVGVGTTFRIKLGTQM